MAGPLDLRGTATVTNNASKSLRDIAKDMQSVSDAGGRANRSFAQMSREGGQAYGSMMGQLSRWQGDALRAQQQSFSTRMGAWQADMAKQVTAVNKSVFEQAGQRAGDAFRRGFQKFKDWDREHGMVTGTIIGGAVRKVSDKLIEQGAEVRRLKNNMLIGGATHKEVDEADEKAKVLTGQYRNMSRAEILSLMSTGRGIYGTQHEGIEHVEPFVRIGSFFKAFDGGKHSGMVHGILGELEAAMKSGEIAGKITPEDLEQYMSGIAATKIATNNQVRVADILKAQRSAGWSYLAMSEQFRQGIFPFLVQEYGPSAGVMAQTAATKLVADVGHKKYAIEAQQDFGIRDADGQIVNSNLYAKNKLEWVLQELAPRFEKKTEGMSKEDAIVEITRHLGKMFPDRNAAKDLIELMIQAPKLKKDYAMRERIQTDPETMRRYTEQSYDYQSQAIETGMKNLAAALGEPVIGPINEGLKKLSGVLQSLNNVSDHSPGKGAGAIGVGAGAALGLGLLLGNRIPGGRALLGGMLGYSAGGGVIGTLLTAALAQQVIGGASTAAGVVRGTAGAALFAPEAIAGIGAAGTAAGVAGKLGWLGRLGGVAMRAAPWLYAASVAGGAGLGAWDAYQKGGGWGDIGKGALWGGFNSATIGVFSSGEAQAAPAGVALSTVGVQAQDAQDQVAAATGDMNADLATLGEQFRAALAGVDLAAEGQRIMESLAAGIRSGTGAAVAAVEDAGHQIEAAASRIRLNTGPMMRGAD